MADPKHGTPPSPTNNRSLDQTAEFYQSAFVTERGARRELIGAVKQVKATNIKLKAECDRQAAARKKILEDARAGEIEAAKPWYQRVFGKRPTKY